MKKNMVLLISFLLSFSWTLFADEESDKENFYAKLSADLKSFGKSVKSCKSKQLLDYLADLSEKKVCIDCTPAPRLPAKMFDLQKVQEALVGACTNFSGALLDEKLVLPLQSESSDLTDEQKKEKAIQDNARASLHRECLVDSYCTCIKNDEKKQPRNKQTTKKQAAELREKIKEQMMSQFTYQFFSSYRMMTNASFWEPEFANNEANSCSPKKIEEMFTNGSCKGEIGSRLKKELMNRAKNDYFPKMMGDQFQDFNNNVLSKISSVDDPRLLEAQKKAQQNGYEIAQKTNNTLPAETMKMANDSFKKIILLFAKEGNEELMRKMMAVMRDPATSCPNNLVEKEFKDKKKITKEDPNSPDYPCRILGRLTMFVQNHPLLAPSKKSTWFERVRGIKKLADELAGLEPAARKAHEKNKNPLVWIDDDQNPLIGCVETDREAMVNCFIDAKLAQRRDQFLLRCREVNANLTDDRGVVYLTIGRLVESMCELQDPRHKVGIAPALVLAKPEMAQNYCSLKNRGVKWSDHHLAFSSKGNETNFLDFDEGWASAAYSVANDVEEKRAGKKKDHSIENKESIEATTCRLGTAITLLSNIDTSDIEGDNCEGIDDMTPEKQADAVAASIGDAVKAAESMGVKTSASLKRYVSESRGGRSDTSLASAISEEVAQKVKVDGQENLSRKSAQPAEVKQPEQLSAPVAGLSNDSSKLPSAERKIARPEVMNSSEKNDELEKLKEQIASQQQEIAKLKTASANAPKESPENRSLRAMIDEKEKQLRDLEGELLASKDEKIEAVKKKKVAKKKQAQIENEDEEVASASAQGIKGSESEKSIKDKAVTASPSSASSAGAAVSSVSSQGVNSSGGSSSSGPTRSSGARDENAPLLALKASSDGSYAMPAELFSRYLDAPETLFAMTSGSPVSIAKQVDGVTVIEVYEPVKDKDGKITYVKREGNVTHKKESTEIKKVIEPVKVAPAKSKRKTMTVEELEKALE